MTTVESKIVAIRRTDEQVYTVLSSFKAFDSIAHAAKIDDWQADDDSCSFNAKGFGPIKLRIIEREPYKTIKITGEEGLPFEVVLWFQFKQVAPYDTRMKITLKADLNIAMAWMVKSKLQEGVDTIAESLAKAFNV